MTETHEESVLACIRLNLERFDFEISADTGVPLEVVREAGARLIAVGRVMSCSVTRYADGVATNAWLYRVSGYLPTPKPGRKPKAPVSPS